MKYILFNKILICGIIIILILPLFSPNSIGFSDKEETLELMKTEEIIDTENMATITCQTYGLPIQVSKQTEISYEIVENLFEKLENYTKVNSERPNSIEADRLRKNIIDLFIQNGILPPNFTYEYLTSNKNSIVKLLPPDIFDKNSKNEFRNIGLCNFATFGEGSQTPIIIIPRLIPILLLPIPRLFLKWSATEAVTTCGGLRNGKGFIANGEQEGTALGFWGIGFNVFLPPIQEFGFIGFALSVSCTAEEIEDYPPNNIPKISDPTPDNNQENVALSLNRLSFKISDEDNDRMSYHVTTNPDIGEGSGSLKNDGTYSIIVSNLMPSTTYKWIVEVSDGIDDTTSSFTFTTVKEKPMVFNPSPANYISVPTSLNEISFELSDPQNDKMDFTVETEPNIGSTQGTNVDNGKISFPVQGLQSNTWYTWHVTVNDGTYETDKEFSFYTGNLGLLGYWSFDDNTDVAHDDSGNRNNGINYGATWTTNSAVGKGALSFDGIDDYINIADSSDFEFCDQSVTFTCWVQIVDNPDDFRRFIGLGDSEGPHPNIILEKCRSKYRDGKLYFGVYDSSGNYRQALSKLNGNQLPKHSWLYVTGVIDYPNSIKLYVDGELIDTVPTLEYDMKVAKDLQLNIGKVACDNQLHKGLLDEVRIYNRALSSDEIKNLYELT